MSQEPKKRHSRQRQGKRRNSIKLEVSGFTKCSNCQNPMKSHMVCKKCGFYKGSEVVTIKVKNKEPKA